MSYAIDVDIMLYASNTSAKEHLIAADFLKQCADSNEICCLAWLTISSYFRMATHPKLFKNPLTPDQALRNIESFTELPHVRCIGEREGFMKTYRQITADVPTRGNLVPDAQLAAVLHQNGVRQLWTHDRDFLKFTFLDVRDPIQQ